VLKETAEIVSAYLQNNQIPADQIPDLIKTTYVALTNAGDPVAEPAAAPAVSIRKSVKPDAITCLECGKSFAMLKRHLRTDHGLTSDEYRAKWSLPAGYPLVAPEYAARRSELALKIGLGRKPGAKKPRAKKA
jgi:predicted transcriptional regulator